MKTLAEAGLIKPERPDKHDPRAARRSSAGATRPPPGYAANAARYPDDDAIIDELGTLTFAEVHDAHEPRSPTRWSDAGIVEGDSIGIMCRNHRCFIESVVAASKIGRELPAT